MEPSSSLLTIFEWVILDEQDVSRQDIREQDPVNILNSAENGQNLPAGFLKIADKLHQTYLDWKNSSTIPMVSSTTLTDHKRDRHKPTQPTFYRYIHRNFWV